MSQIINYIFSNLFYKSFTGDFIPQFSFYYIMPWFVILFATLGLPYIIKNKKWLFYELILGIIFWIFYSISTFRIIIGFERVVFFTSILVVLVSAFGITEIKKYLIFKFRKINLVLKIAEIFILIFFILFIPFYTQRETWKELILINPKTKLDSFPMAPANNYLTSEDLRIFKNIKQKKFLSNPWKSAVIAIAMDNYPVVTKGGTITMSSDNPLIYQQFLKFDCEKKMQFAKEKNIDYVYSDRFLCDNFQEVNISSEGFILYEFSN